MKRFGLLIAVLAVAGAALGTASARTEKTQVICHRTASKTKPYVKLRVSAKGAKTHARHAADIVPAPRGGCPRSVLTPTSGGTAFEVALTGEAEQPAGDPVATGEATVRLRRGQGQLCYTLQARNLPSAAVGVHIHSGAAGTSGGIVVPLRGLNAEGDASACIAASRAVVNRILGSPASYYVNIHTAESPGGAVRGQLTGTSTEEFGWIVAVRLVGSTEPNASGTAVVRIRKAAGLVCYRLNAANITLPATAAHIHRGTASQNGPVVVPFDPPNASGKSTGCTAASQALIDEIVANPAGFYVNVHTREHPAGAMRAQLG
jgi:hypothetical protein